MTRRGINGTKPAPRVSARNAIHDELERGRLAGMPISIRTKAGAVYGADGDTTVTALTVRRVVCNNAGRMLSLTLSDIASVTVWNNDPHAGRR